MSVTQQQLERRCRYWQKMLGLSDWKIKVKLARPEEMDDEDNQGECAVSSSNREASIRILHPTHYPTTSPFPQDWEATLLHELIEVYFDPFKVEKGPMNLIQEQAIQAIANGLVATSRA